MNTRRTILVAALIFVGIAGFLWQLRINAGLRREIATLKRQQGAFAALEQENARLALRLAEATSHGDSAAATATRQPAATADSLPDRRGDRPEVASRDEQLGYERAFHQDLARRRAEQAKAFARFDDEHAGWDPAARYHALIQHARLLAADGQFRVAIRRYNQAMEDKPADLPITADVQELQQTLQAQNSPVSVTFRSDGHTFVTVSDWKPLKTFEATTEQILPGNYEVIGQRRGFREVRMPLILRGGMPAPVVTVVCTQPADTP